MRPLLLIGSCSKSKRIGIINRLERKLKKMSFIGLASSGGDIARIYSLLPLSIILGLLISNKTLIIGMQFKAFNALLLAIMNPELISFNIIRKLILDNLSHIFNIKSLINKF
jgi:hypothetical protein